MKYGETIKRWNIDLDGQQHTLRFEHQFWTGEKKYYINDELVEHVPGSILQSASFAKDVPFTLGTHQGVFQLRALGRMVFYDLVIDGETIAGEEKSALRLPLWVITLLIIGLIYLALFSMSANQ